MPKVDKWRLCWDYNKDAKAIIQSTLTNVVPFCEQMGPRVWVGKPAEYPSPSWLEETRINGKQEHCQDFPVLHVISCLRAHLCQIHSFAVWWKLKCKYTNYTIKLVFLFHHCRFIHSCCNKFYGYIYNVSRTSTVPRLICQSAPTDGLRLGRALWLRLLN